jgi:hypothetical protein
MRWTRRRGARGKNARGGVYVIVDLEEDRVRYVGRSRDVERRIRALQLAGGPYADASRYRGVPVAQIDDYAAQRGVEQRAMDEYFGVGR